MYDLLLKNGMILDGTGAPAYPADLAIKNGKIHKIAPCISGDSLRTIDVEGLAVAPGFIDFHSHCDGYALFGTPGYEKLEQGVTTEIAGHCGDSIVPAYPGFLDGVKGLAPDELIRHVTASCETVDAFADTVSHTSFGTNMAFFIGHGSLRARCMGFLDKKPTIGQMDEMKHFVRRAMERGFIGLSTGLIYPPSVFADTDELAELASVAAEYGGRYTSHVRGEGDTVEQAVEEAITIGERSGCDTIISHLKIYGKRNKGKSKSVCSQIIEANRRGKIRVYADQYPYIAGCTSLTAVIPPAFTTDGIPALLSRLSDQNYRSQIRSVMEKGGDGGSLITYCGFDGCLVLTADATQEVVGKNLAQVAQARSCSCYDAVFDLISANRGNVLMAFFGQNETDMMHILSMPFLMAGTDTGHNIQLFDPETSGGAHPRGMSTFTRHLRLVRDNKLFPPEQAVRRITSMAADAAGLDCVGRLLEGYAADITVFDWENISENNDFLHPYRRNTGIEYVIVNGALSVERGVFTGVKAGKFLQKRPQ